MYFNFFYIILIIVVAHFRGIALQLINIFEVKVQLLEELYLYLLLLTSTTGLLLSLPQSSSIPFLLLLFLHQQN